MGLAIVSTRLYTKKDIQFKEAHISPHPTTHVRPSLQPAPGINNNIFQERAPVISVLSGILIWSHNFRVAAAELEFNISIFVKVLN